jgi:outer membrane protein OmpA-like peptidoglycan-associated protein
MSGPQRPSRTGRRGMAVLTDTASEIAWRRLIILGLVLALLVIGLITGILRLGSAAHHVAGSPRPASVAGTLPYGLVGGGGVVPRRATGKLAIGGAVGQVLFAENGTALDSYARTVIGNAALTIRARHLGVVVVIGYTDAIGSAPANAGLARRRAAAVLRALRQRLGPEPMRYRVQARGQTTPVASNSTAAGRQLNRRVLIAGG